MTDSPWARPPVDYAIEDDVPPARRDIDRATVVIAAFIIGVIVGFVCAF